GGAGGAIGALRGHMKGRMKDSDLKELGEVLDGGEAGLIVVYAVNMADQIAANIKAANRHISEEIDASADELAKQLNELEGAAT
ncbi:MAG TPA: hypothetical protein VN606_06615, partial [Thermoleophilaceae bacterium]|nr:hypothetical protein [Thermoleophilaceae bacterium]